MDAKQFRIAVDTIRRDFPVGQPLEERLQERKKAIQRLMHHLTCAEMAVVKKADLGGLPKHMRYMIVKAYHDEMSSRSETVLPIPSIWDRLMAE